MQLSKNMERILKFEELGQFILSLFLFSQLNFPWWYFPALLLLPDLSMIAYLINPRAGAWLYNFFHHKLLAIMILILGFYLDNPILTLTGVILFGHSAMDRIFGYGLKYEDNFQNTHLGWIGKHGI